MMPVASCIPFPFFVPCNDMLVMLFCATHWLYVHLYSHVYMFMHESCLLVCRPWFNTMRLWTFDLNLHLSLTNTTFCLLSCLFTLCLLFVILLVYPFAHMFACILYAMLVIAILLVCFAPFCLKIQWLDQKLWLLEVWGALIDASSQFSWYLDRSNLDFDPWIDIGMINW